MSAVHGAVGAEGEEYLPLTERSFRVLIRRYEEEAAAAARAVAVSCGEDTAGSCRDMAVAAQYIADLAHDAQRLFRKFQACGSGSSDSTTTTAWTLEDVHALRLLGFDVRGIDAVSLSSPLEEEGSRVDARGSDPSRRPQKSNLDALLFMEQKLQALQLKADGLAAENVALRRTVAGRRRTGQKTQTADAGTHDPVVALTTALNELKDALIGHRERASIVQEMRERFALALHEIRVGDRKVSDAASGEADYPYSVIEEAFCVLRRVDACQRVRYCMGNTCDDVEPVDTAVIQLLNDLDFPFPVHIRRLGPGGDYFIDSHVEIKLVDQQLLVRPWPAAGHRLNPADGGGANHSRNNNNNNNSKSRPRYEHLAKYLIHLYSPAMDLDKAAATEGYNVADLQRDQTRYESSACLCDHIASLKHQQQRLRRTLENRYQQLQRHQRRLEEGLSPSPSRPLREDGFMSSGHIDASSDQARRAWRGKETQRPQSTSTEDRVSHILHLLETNGRVPDLSSLSKSELQCLKRTTLRRQMHAFKGFTGVISPRSRSQSS
ncbi:hypothetical protein DQ04_02841070 [Trypanosoma grayi]|uniref:hypothetical protein n=1 Tax=Trypanosoma grayi TaxID=71804 RepID=UPI0004F48816|nr:hypothetical protein DQ04_02841070 [Trypanosoma grayi]KEG11225.1 hypothetical protein DQ04_02841070 [Trypanosoma grayi]